LRIMFELELVFRVVDPLSGFDEFIYVHLLSYGCMIEAEMRDYQIEGSAGRGCPKHAEAIISAHLTAPRVQICSFGKAHNNLRLRPKGFVSSGEISKPTRSN
jgi:hypothetical protein